MEGSLAAHLPFAMSSYSTYKAKVLISPTASTIGNSLSFPIIQACQSALNSRNAFTIALSGGSLPTFLQALPQAFQSAGIDPHWEKWHVLLADERCVPSSDDDSNVKSIRENFTNRVDIPMEQVYGIDETLLGKGSKAVAQAYMEKVVIQLLEISDGMIDCVVLVSSSMMICDNVWWKKVYIYQYNVTQFYFEFTTN